jgi:hypothetical protein
VVVADRLLPGGSMVAIGRFRFLWADLLHKEQQ